MLRIHFTKNVQYITTAIMGKTVPLTVIQKTIINTLHREGEPQKVIADCWQTTVSKHIYGKLTGADCNVKRIVKKLIQELG